jgi:hypothetical protein
MRGGVCDTLWNMEQSVALIDARDAHAKLRAVN